MNYYKKIRPFVFKLAPESAHNAAIKLLSCGLMPRQKPVKSDLLSSSVFGVEFKNPIGMAAGFDKNASAIDGLFSQGFGFVEVGTSTPKPQYGNPKPRIFRLHEDSAIINRLGFNNKGSDVFVSNLKCRKSAGVVGVNIGKNKDTQDAASDYLYMMEKTYGLGDYFTINISSPNTPGLRGLQSKDELGSLLNQIMQKREELVKIHKLTMPILVKIAPDNTEEQYEDIAKIALEYKVDGLIISNTTIGCRDALTSRFANETGGLSGKPAFEISTKALQNVYKETKGKVPIIGVGGILSAEDAYIKIKSGASLVQVYSALIYEGFELVSEINEGLIKLIKMDGFDNISQAIGADVVI